MKSGDEALSDLLKGFVADSMIRALARSATHGHTKKLQRRTARRFDRYEQRIRTAQKAGGRADPELTATAENLLSEIKTAFRKGQFRRSKSKSRRKQDAPPPIYSGGLPGLGKRR